MYTENPYCDPDPGAYPWLAADWYRVLVQPCLDVSVPQCYPTPGRDRRADRPGPVLRGRLEPVRAQQPEHKLRPDLLYRSGGEPILRS